MLEMASEMEDAAAEGPVHRVFVNTIDVAYANPDKNPAEIRELVLGDCELDGDGKPALRTLWPWRR